MRTWNDWISTLALCTCLVLVTSTASSAQTASVIHVQLQDASTNGSLEGMRMTATPDIAKAGKVTVNATNLSHSLVHEVVVIRTDATNKPLPYDPKAGVVKEKEVRDMGEIYDLDPGRSGSLTVDLSPGSYLLICNQPGHYKAGMWTKLTVTR
jgi:uncharacterized cupredoxin-like copper-binding protein